MEIYFLIIVIPLILFLARKTSLQIKQRRLNALESLIKNNQFQEIDLELITVEGFHYSEHVAVDVYDNKIDDKKYTNYSNPYQLSNKFHKNKQVTKFHSNLKLDFKFEGKVYKLKAKLPLDEITLRMSFLTEKKGRIFIEETEKSRNASKEKYLFYLEIGFLNYDNTRFLELKKV